jgi:hypothetical protein
MTLLPEAGGWRRDGIAVGDGPLRESQDVLWLQVGDAYADMRLGGERPWAFAGVTTVTSSRVTWTHVIETAPDGFEDTGEMVPIPGGFAERGTFSDGTPYLEVWKHVDGPTAPARASVRGDAHVVRLGGRALWVTPRGAVRLLLSGSSWTLDALVDAAPAGVEEFLASGADCPVLFVEALRAA